MNRAVTAVAAVAVVASAASMAWASRPVDLAVPPTPQPSNVAITQAALACPTAQGGRKAQRSVLAVSAPMAGAGSADASGGSLDLSGGVAGSSSERGVAVEAELEGRRPDPVAVVATGALAPGLAAAQATRSVERSSGWAVTACGAAADAWWFGGLATSVGSTSQLVLTNPTPAVAVVDLTFYGPDGPIEADGARDVAVAPGAELVQDLALFAPGEDALGLQVTADSGRVVAAVHVERVDGVTPQGTEWVSPSAPPSTDILVNAGFAGNSRQQLQLVNTSDREALVQVEIVDENGPFAPLAVQDLQVAPGAVLVKDLTSVTGANATAIHLTANTDVFAALVDESRQAPDFAVAAAGPQLAGPAVVPVLDRTDLSLTFATAAAASGKVSITGYTADGAQRWTEELNLPGRRATSWELSPRRAERTDYVVVDLAVDPETHGVVHYLSRRGIASMPLLSGPSTVVQPAVGPRIP